MKTRVLLVDDHPMFREGLATVLSTTDDLEVVGDVGSGEEAVEAAERLDPAVVVIDVHLPGISGIEAARRIVAAHPGIGVLMLTMSAEDETVFQAIRAGARGYLLKGSDGSGILHAVRAVGSGQAIFGPVLARRLTGYFGSRRAGAAPFSDLTDRERDVLELMARGHNNSDIALLLDINAKTVRNNVSNVFAKLHVASRAQAIVRAREAGIGA